jgi:hypothetical protein
MIEIQEAKKRKPKGVQYFTQDTENAINEYNTTTDFELKDKIYRERIHYAFFKLTENIIHTFKFYYTEVDNIQDLQHEVITFLLSKIHLFNPARGAKAFSYFGTIAKRYLIITNTKNYKKRVDKAPIEEIESNENFSYRIDEGSSQDRLSNFLDEYITYCTTNIYTLFPKEIDAQIADAILELFRIRENIEDFNKKSIYILIRERTGLKTQNITRVINVMKADFERMFTYYHETGRILA